MAKTEILSSTDQNGLNRQIGPKIDIWAEYDTVEKRKALGCEEKTAQGFGDLLDVNKIVPRLTPEQIMALKDKQMKANYGIQTTDTIRDVMLKAKALATDFMELPAYIRDHFRNNEFTYQEFLQKHSDNEFALVQLQAELTNSDSLKNFVERMKQEKIEKEQAIVAERDANAQALAKAIKGSSDPAPKS